MKVGHGWTHDGLALDLARKLMHGGKTWCWLNSTIGAWSGPRPDIMSYRRYTYDTPQIHAFEIKVSRSDLLSDLNAGKWRSYLEHCQSVTFAMPHGFATKVDIPAECGVMFRTGRGWRTERRPTSIGTGCSIQSMAKLLTMHPLRLPPSEGDAVLDKWRANDIQQRAADQFRRECGSRFGHALARLAADVALGKDPAGQARDRAVSIIEDAKTQAEHVVGWLGPLCESLNIPFDPRNLWGLRNEVTARLKAVDADHRTKLAAEALAKAREAIELAEIRISPVEQSEAA